MSPALDLSNGVSASLSNGHSLPHTNGLHTNGGSHPLKSKPTPPTDGFSTLAIHTGSHPDPSTGAVIPPISLSTTFAQSSPGVHLGFEYSRSDNPNRRALEELLASIEVGGKEGLGFASGSAATGVVVQALGGARVVEREGRDGERVRDVEVPHVLSVNDVYGGTYRYLKRVASEGQGLEVTLLDIENATEEDIRAAIRPNTKLIWLESPTNPTLKTLPIPLIARIAREPLPGSTSVPILLGADLVLHSLTKYVNGHSDVVMGGVIAPDPSSHPAPQSLVGRNPEARQEQAKKFYEKLRFLQNATGAIPSPYDCWLAQRGAKTLGLRMKAHGVNGLKVAKVLEAHPLVQKVIYPGLPSNPGYKQAWANLSSHARRWIEEEVVPLSSKSTASSATSSYAPTPLSPPSPISSMDSLPASSTYSPSPLDPSSSSPADRANPPTGGFPFSGMVSFSLSSYDAAVAFLQKSRLFTLAESLGGVESLAEHPASMTHGGIPRVSAPF
ncbi:cystathionine gamma-synthase [Coprinellus micaceus]|uniref:cystathionine gamma-lyase n=1 Tax=Coprinellus micaceus TaxID=71717 RepID=A0A4Y7SE53_COPMI|nr:cystathionine gamma-synthase [Coprinellus micaceus]